MATVIRMPRAEAQRLLEELEYTTWEKLTQSVRERLERDPAEELEFRLDEELPEMRQMIWFFEIEYLCLPARA